MNIQADFKSPKKRLRIRDLSNFLLSLPHKIPGTFPFLEKGLLPKVLLLLFMAIAIIYMLTPKFFAEKEVYYEGDIFSKDIVSEKDLLLPDTISTELNQKQQLDNLGFVFDYSPKVEETTRQVQTAFREMRSSAQQIKESKSQLEQKTERIALDYFFIHQEQYETQARAKFYLIYQEEVQQKALEFSKKESLSSLELLQKRQLDNVSIELPHLLQDLKGKEKIFAREVESTNTLLQEQLQKSREQNRDFETQRLQAIKKYLQTLNLSLTEIEMQGLDFPFYQEENERILLNILRNFLSQKIIASDEILKNAAGKIHDVRNLVSNQTTTLEDISQIHHIQTVRAQTTETIKELSFEENAGRTQNFLNLLAPKLILANLTENKQEYEKKKDDIIKNLSPVFYRVKKGQMIARRGDKATKTEVEMIKSYQNVREIKVRWPRIIALLLICLVSFPIAYTACKARHRELMSSTGKLFLVCLTILSTLVITKLGIVIGETMASRYPEFQSFHYSFAYPVVLCSLLLTILMNFEIAMIGGLLTSVFVSLMMQDSIYYFYYSMFGSLVASLPLTNFDSRHSIIKQGLKVGGINIPMVFILHFIQDNSWETINIYSLVAAFIGGNLAAIIASFLLPAFESAFDITTNMKLLELSNMNNPALKTLMYQAPGTYQHSILVGNLAESGAEQIGANPLLARVASYYHDLGKGVTPQFFIENLGKRGKNGHDPITPKESARYIIQHLENGGEIADKHRLGTKIKDILLQHHGTTLVKYFYYQAKKSADIEGKEVNEDDFRYLGPKPQSLEAALVMIADAAEAATRSLDDPTPESISKMVNKIGRILLDDGQLDECGMTMKDYRVVMNTYSSLLNSIHHHRIKYPGQKE